MVSRAGRGGLVWPVGKRRRPRRAAPVWRDWRRHRGRTRAAVKAEAVVVLATVGVAARGVGTGVAAQPGAPCTRFRPRIRDARRRRCPRWTRCPDAGRWCRSSVVARARLFDPAGSAPSQKREPKPSGGRAGWATRGAGGRRVGRSCRGPSRSLVNTLWGPRCRSAATPVGPPSPGSSAARATDARVTRRTAAWRMPGNRIRRRDRRRRERRGSCGVLTGDEVTDWSKWRPSPSGRCAVPISESEAVRPVARAKRRSVARALRSRGRGERRGHAPHTPRSPASRTES